MALPTPRQLLKKARRSLAWAREQLFVLANATRDENLDLCDQAMHRILSDINSAAEALLDASRVLDSGLIRTEVMEARKSDPLLRYFWKARDAATHHVVEWELSFGNAEVQVVDPIKANAATANSLTEHDRMRKLNAGIRPDPALLESLGIELIDQKRALGLSRIEYERQGEVVVLERPTVHMGNEDFPPEASAATEAVLRFYESKAALLEAIAQS
jgi:hypothetical protein